MRTIGLEFIAWIAVSVAVLGPGLWTDPHAVPGGVWTDVHNSMWSMQFAADALTSGALPWHTDALNHPAGGTVLLPDPLGALFAGFAVPVLGMAGAYTAWIVLQLALSGWAMQHFATAWLAPRLERPRARRAGWVAGLAYSSAPVLLAGAACGTTEAVAGAPPVLAAWAAWKAATEPGARTAIAAGGALLLAALASWYAAVIAAVFAAVLALRAVPAVGLRALGPLAAGLALVVPLAVWTHGIHADPGHLATRDPAILDGIRATFGAASVLGLVWPIDAATIAVQDPMDAGQGYLHTGYLGAGLLIAAAVGCVREPRAAVPWLLAGALCAALSVGPGPNGTRPYALVDQLPGFRNLSLVWRLAGGASIAVALLAALATQGTQRACGVVAAVVAFQWAVLSPTAGGIPVTDAEPPAVLAAIARAPAGAVVTLPASAAHADLWLQAHHRQPVTGTINRRRSAAAADWALGAETDDWATVQRTAQDAGIRYVLMRQSRSLRASSDRFLVQQVQQHAEKVGESGRWTAYAVW
ncbi:MAG: hypothetical protein VX944_04530 [Myxococcota bacterium]|nr:hypothetical protein [Myxococcota bacterium]